MCNAPKPNVRNNSGSQSPVRHVDPFLRAVNTVMYGIVVHFATCWMMPQPQDSYSCDQPSWIRMILSLHEYWVYLQHFNVLANPLCQRLDRQYGIALLKSNQHWAIAGTLTAYWCREAVSMFLCLPFVTSRLTQYLILYSLVYHTIKSRGVRQDALQRYSSTFGIMRIVIDKFYLHTMHETILSIVRLMLQGVDTWIHFRIISGMVSSFEVSMPMIHWLFGLWVFHAAMNQLFRCSTASIMVQGWYWMTDKSKSQPEVDLVDTSDDDDDDDSQSESDVFREGNDADQDFIVRTLLQDGRVSDKLKGRNGAASEGVDTSVRIETVCAAVATVYIVGLGDVPFRILATVKEGDDYGFLVLVPFAWLLWNVLHACSVVLFQQPSKTNKGSWPGWLRKERVRGILNVVDVLMIVMGASSNKPEPPIQLLSVILIAGVTAKSFTQAMQCQMPRIFRIATMSLEFLAKVLLMRSIGNISNTAVATVGAAVTCVWMYVTVCNVNFGGSALNETNRCNAVADIVFLGHPAELHDCWALWLLPYSLDKRWKRPWWAFPLWPFHYLVGYFVCNWRQRLFGDGASFLHCDDVLYGNVRMQTWIANNFGRHFVTHQRAVKCNIEAAARYADSTGVKVLCLGALNKAESINRGGVGVVRALGPQRSMSIIHGNHLTAAAVVETSYQVFGDGAKVFLTGASSKVGWAVARALRDRYGYQILCHSTDQSRREMFERNGFQAASTLQEGTFFSNLWIVGKCDFKVADYMPQNGTAVVFSVPHPLQRRKDVRVIEAGTLHMDLKRLDRPRRFANKLAAHEIFACHAAGVVAVHRLQRDALDRIEETGPVNPNTMDEWLTDAKTLGFSVPYVEPVFNIAMKEPQVIIIGAGPAGLAVAACLRRRGVLNLTVLDEQIESAAYGSWEKHFSGLEITTQKRWCNLPGFIMDDKDFPGEHLTASTYMNYLRLYAKRFGIEVRRGHRVKKVTHGGETSPWIVHCEETTLTASAVVVATGKNRIARRDTSDGLYDKLSSRGIKTVHTTDLHEEKIWTQAIDAARKGKLCVIGFGNSAADLCTAILQACDSSNSTTAIHVAARTIPPVFPRKRGLFRVDTVGSFIRWMPHVIQDVLIQLLWWALPCSAACNAAFPAHLPRWSKVNGRVPVIDKYGQLASALRSGTMVGHGPVRNFLDENQLVFDDVIGGRGGKPVLVDMVIMATGYKHECIIGREDRLNNLYCCGFGNDQLLPLKSISEDAESIARDILRS